MNAPFRLCIFLRRSIFQQLTAFLELDFASFQLTLPQFFLECRPLKTSVGPWFST
jgi:hypothetical protein